MPLSDRLTRSTSDACSAIDRFLWITPSPPCCAIAIARRDSVTVSIAALTSGTFNRILRVSRVLTSTSVGTTSECRGTSSTSSNVRAVARPDSVDRSVGISVFSSISSCGRAVTFLVFLPASARARIVAAYLRLVVAERRHLCVVAADACGLTCRPAAAAELGCLCGRAAERGHRLSRAAAEDQRGPGAPDGTRRRRLLAVAQHRTEPPHVTDDFLVHAVFHSLEERKALFLVLNQRIALAVAAQADPFLEMVEAVEVILPLLVDDLQHDVALDALQYFAADQFFFFVVRRDDFLPEQIANLVRGPIVELHRGGINGEHAGRLAPERVEVPLLEVGLAGSVHIDGRVEDLFRERHQILARPECFLLAALVLHPDLALENLPAQRVDVLALLVHHVVVLEEVFADREVLRLDLLLSALDGARHHAVLDRNAFLHTELLHQTRDAIRPEDPHEIVFER